MVPLLSNCSSVPISDETVCADEGSQGAFCAHLLTTATSNIPKAAWDDQRFGYFCISPKTFGDFKTEIEQLCSIAGDCTYATGALNNISALQKK